MRASDDDDGIEPHTALHVYRTTSATSATGGWLGYYAVYVCVDLTYVSRYSQYLAWDLPHWLKYCSACVLHVL